MSNLLQFSENIADAEAPPLLPAGEYPAVCIEANQTLSKSSGNPLLPLKFVIKREAFPADFDGDDDEITLTYNRLVVRDQRRDRFNLKRVCSAMGVPMSNTVDPNEFVGKPARLKITQKPGLDGEPRNEIDSILAI